MLSSGISVRHDPMPTYAWTTLINCCSNIDFDDKADTRRDIFSTILLDVHHFTPAKDLLHQASVACFNIIGATTTKNNCTGSLDRLLRVIMQLACSPLTSDDNPSPMSRHDLIRCHVWRAQAIQTVSDICTQGTKDQYTAWKRSPRLHDEELAHAIDTAKAVLLDVKSDRRSEFYQTKLINYMIAETESYHRLCTKVEILVPSSDHSSHTMNEYDDEMYEEAMLQIDV
jgi:hypothetical protein